MKKVLITLIILSTIVILPYLFWKIDDSNLQKVTIIDKTVPTNNYREHHGLTWYMNYLRYSPGVGNKPLIKSKDYYGYHPNQETINGVNRLEELTNASDIIYVADTYGVYEQEDLNDQITSNKITGGFTQEELAVIDQKLRTSETKLFMEFNSFASPTEPEVRNQLTSMLGIEWTGWTGRYFSSLNIETDHEIPQWAIAYYEEQNNLDWNFLGSGYIFTHEDGRVIVMENSSKSNGINFTFTEKGQQITGMTQSQEYSYWFDIHVQINSDNVLAEYNLQLEGTQLDQLRSEGIPSSFPAVISSSYYQSNLYYFAGDFADISDVPSFYQYKGLPFLNKILTTLSSDQQKAFFWRTYIPMLKQLLEEPHVSTQSEGNTH
ncbi:hypothetical protein GH741_11765 [Aquibacillus halophilus]|uniref:Uncharacterized protein n=1 Tax=Aquibacillus halophilus TaxID=930132 RepID=A0A6A8DCC8_9BACI|nr:hypothetical protein [Aquibacillus halophilus]MRH43355.1 hypothetical protein [Aquibacillus halophilus]